MRVTEIRDLVRLKRIHLDPVDRALANCHDADAWRAAAARVLPRGVFDFVDGGAEQEVTLQANRAAFRSWRWVPKVLVDVSDVDTSSTLFGEEYAAPFGLAPVGGTRFVHPAGELAVARAAAFAKVPYTLASMANTSLELVATAGLPSMWFQLYVQRDRSVTVATIERAAAAGYHVLEVSIDNAVTARRMREVRSGMTMPPQLTPSTAVNLALHVRYWTRMLRVDRLGFPNWLPESPPHGSESYAGAATAFDPAVTWDDIADLRERWKGRLLIKGLLSSADIVRARDLGLDGVHLSNHGGRQLDRTMTPLHLLPSARCAAGEHFTIVVDSGIRDGGDIAMALALGADFCAVGRAYLYPLAVAGEAGVRLAISQITSQLEQTMALLGITSVRELQKAGHDLLIAAP